ncbi:diguanylate cyclase [Campylobacterota bacterium]
MKKILIIDDDITILRFLKGLISHKFNIPYDTATSMEAAQHLLQNPQDYAVALVDVVLPDAKEGACIDLVIKSDIPVIAMTASGNDQLNKNILEKDILDYVNKENASSFDYAMRLIQFIHGFEGSEILLVDDSVTSRLQIKFSLGKLPLTIHEADDGQMALEVLEKHKKIKLIITDKNMPNMDGLKLIQAVRKDYSMNELSVIGISASSEPMMSVEFLKHGANDFITKPFMPEEMLSRVISSLEMLYYIELAEKSAVKDFLTGLYNRKFLYETGKKLYENAKRENLSIVVAMIDIDHFKKINDRYGHEAGDIALKRLGMIFLENFRSSDILTRYGGEEFCILLTNTDVKSAVQVMEKVSKIVEETMIELNNISFRMTLSVGINDDTCSSFDDMIALADKRLYQAKHEGRNRVIS